MTLNSFSFLLYFAVLLTLLFVLQLLRKIGIIERRVVSLQIIVLLSFSYCFIAKTDWRFLLCVIGVTLISYLTGIILKRVNYRDDSILVKKISRSQLIVIMACFILLAILFYFKYANFFIDSLNKVIGYSSSTLNIIMPIGISFYIFSALSYIFDVYKGKYEAEENLVYFALYLALFSKIIAGPIVRADAFFPQVKSYRGVEQKSVLEGIQIFFFGLFKKIVLADHLGVFVDDVFRAPTAYNTVTVILGVLSYSMQLYFDFSGYSDMAIGISKIIGFDFEPNFNLPYIAGDISDFWSRWHISLSSWLKEYVYIPLGGNRKGEQKTCFNLLVTMIVSGLWHGAGWTYVLWGVIHGIVCCFDRIIKRGKSKILINKVFGIGVTYTIVSLLWVIFRASSINNAWVVICAMFTVHSGINQPYAWTFFALTILLIATFLAVKRNQGNGFYPILNLRKFSHQLIFFVFCGLTILMGYFGNTAFIYSQF